MSLEYEPTIVSLTCSFRLIELVFCFIANEIYGWNRTKNWTRLSDSCQNVITFMPSKCIINNHWARLIRSLENGNTKQNLENGASRKSLENQIGESLEPRARKVPSPAENVQQLRPSY